MDIIIRPTRKSDYNQLLEVEIAATPGLSYLPNVFDMFLHDITGPFLTAEVDDKVVGCGKFTMMFDGSAWLETLRVLPEFQGKGVGKAFYDEFLKLSKLKHISQLRMYTGLKNVVSKGLAEKYGFQLVGTFKTASCTVMPYLHPLESNNFLPVKNLEDINPGIDTFKENWGNLIGLNRTFFSLNEGAFQELIKFKWLYANSDGVNSVILGSRFMPEKALYILAYLGDPKSILGFAIQKAIEVKTQKLICHFPASVTRIFDDLSANGMQIEPSEIIVMERDQSWITKL